MCNLIILKSIKIKNLFDFKRNLIRFVTMTFDNLSAMRQNFCKEFITYV